jgi:hypothetical protein
MDDFAKVLELTKDVSGLISAVAGITEEELEFEGFDGVQGKGKAAIVLVGWESIEKHEAYWETGVFEKVQPLLKSTAKGTEMHHIKFAMHGGKELEK